MSTSNNTNGNNMSPVSTIFDWEKRRDAFGQLYYYNLVTKKKQTASPKVRQEALDYQEQRDRNQSKTA